MKARVLAPALLLATSAPVLACDYCLVSQGISPLETVNGAGLRVHQRYSQLDEVYQGTREMPNPGASERHWTTEITGFRNLTGDFLVQATLPLRRTSGIRDVSTAADGSVDLGTDTGGATGIGDISLLGRYIFFRQHSLASTTVMAATLGVKLPTGDTDARGDQDQFLEAHTQPGTGSTDALVGLSATHSIRRWTLSTNLLASFTGEGKAGVTHHQFGNSLNYDFTARYRVSPATVGASPLQWFLSLGVNGEWLGQEHEDDVRLPDSGGHVLYLSPGVQLIINGHWILEALFQQPVHHDLDGTQLGESWKVAGGLTYLF